MIVPGRIEMGAVVGGELHGLHRPALSVRQILAPSDLEEAQHSRQALLVIDVLDQRMIPGGSAGTSFCSGTEMSISCAPWRFLADGIPLRAAAVARSKIRKSSLWTNPTFSGPPDRNVASFTSSLPLAD
jgi:hypothetical protein